MEPTDGATTETGGAVAVPLAGARRWRYRWVLAVGAGAGSAVLFAVVRFLVLTR